MHCNSTVTSTGNFVASRSYCIFTVVTFYSEHKVHEASATIHAITGVYYEHDYAVFPWYIPI